MPNHIQSKLVITGDADIIRKLIDTISTPNEDEGSTRYIDFEKIIPMPEWYKTSESSTESNLSLAVYLYNTDRIDELNRICSFVSLPIILSFCFRRSSTRCLSSTSTITGTRTFSAISSLLKVTFSLINITHLSTLYIIT